MGTQKMKWVWFHEFIFHLAELLFLCHSGSYTKIKISVWVRLKIIRHHAFRSMAIQILLAED